VTGLDDVSGRRVHINFFWHARASPVLGEVGGCVRCATIAQNPSLSLSLSPAARPHLLLPALALGACLLMPGALPGWVRRLHLGVRWQVGSDLQASAPPTLIAGYELPGWEEGWGIIRDAVMGEFEKNDPSAFSLPRHQPPNVA
jgi:hypothetical protein